MCPKFLLVNSRRPHPGAMEKVKIAKDDAVPLLKQDGSNYELWRASYLAYYCCQLNVVMAIAREPNVKQEKIEEDEKKMMTTTIFRSIHQTLRMVYIQQKAILEDGYLLWKTLEERFLAVDQEQRDLERFMGFKQGNRPLGRFVMEYDNLRRKLEGSSLNNVMSEQAMIRHLHRALSPHPSRCFHMDWTSSTAWSRLCWRIRNSVVTWRIIST